MNIFFAVLIVLVVLLYLYQQRKQGVLAANMANEVKEKLAKGALVVDVRTSGEYAEGHYQDAKNIPLDQVAHRLSEFGDDKSKPIVVYCLSGARSESAKNFLTNQGYTDVTNAGGIGDMPNS
ncbi:MAG: rhodanese-like domain-containing protein [Spirochaetota bacterium]